VTTKICSKCKVEKDVGEFYKDRTAKCGLNGRCRLCDAALVKKWRDENPEKVKEQERRRREKDIDGLRAIRRARNKRWRDENQEKAKEKGKRWRVENQERYNELQRRFRAGLSDSFVRSALRIPNPPQELIELKRLRLQIHRELKQQGEVK